MGISLHNKFFRFQRRDAVTQSQLSPKLIFTHDKQIFVNRLDLLGLGICGD